LIFNLNARMRFPYDILEQARKKLTVMGRCSMKISTLGRLVTSVVLAPCAMISAAHAQDVPGIEICTVEKTMERRTSCLQSNVDFLQKTITRLGADQQQRLDAANRQIEGLKGTVAGLQKMVDDLRAAPKKAMEDQKKADAPPASNNAAPAAQDAKK
jgi:hypothetical protein